MTNSTREKYIGKKLGDFVHAESQSIQVESHVTHSLFEDKSALSEYIHHLEDETVRLPDEVTVPEQVQQENSKSAAQLASKPPLTRANYAGTVVEPNPANNWAEISLGVWAYYFAAKLSLSLLGSLSFHWLANLLLAGFILLPAVSRTIQRLKMAVVIPLSIALLYYDSWLPDIRTVIEKASLLSSFSTAYLWELLSRFVSFPAIGLMFVACLLIWLLPSKMQIGILFTVGALTSVHGAQSFDMRRIFQESDRSVVAEGAMPDMNNIVQDFFKKEDQRSVLLTKPSENAVPFDVIFIHICSLSWDDIKLVGLQSHPLWQRFDILLTKFNSAASYSGPAAIHLLRSTCGQQSHDKLYLPTHNNCYLLGSLQAVGFAPELALNHNGKFDTFLVQLRKYGDLDEPLLSQNGLDAVQQAFDGSPVYDDLSVLNRWFEARQKSNNSRVALYYNTLSLHDGNHFSGMDATSGTLRNYKVRLARFLDEMDAFMQKLEKSGRRAVVVMVPEHGAALRGDQRQISGMREIPTPAITLVPVGIRIVGGHLIHNDHALSVDQPTSYLAIAHILELMLKNSPFSSSRFSSADYIANLPTTQFVAQTDKNTVAEYEHHYYLNNGSGMWENYIEFDQPLGDH